MTRNHWGSIMDLERIIEEIERNKPKIKLSNPIESENEKFITQSWQDGAGNLIYKSFHKQMKYTMHSKNGKFHNLDGPAIIRPSGDLEWWYEDQKIACAHKKDGEYKFSEYTPVDESLIKESVCSLDLLTVVKARESHDKNLTIDEIITRDRRFPLAQNIHDIVKRMRSSEDSKSNSMKP